MADPYTESAEQFRRDVKDHQMQILHEDGLYRHVRFTSNPHGYGEYWFDLVTWPGALAISGDMGGYTFRRVEDMFTFFRMHRTPVDGRLQINPHYWSEKLDGGRESAKAYSEDLFKQRVAEELEAAEEDCPGVTAAWNAKVDGIVPDYYTATEEEARRALEDFEFGTVYKVSCDCGVTKDFDNKDSADSWRFIRHDPSHKTTVRRAGFWFQDTWEWDLTDYTYQFLWCCHAIVWGISEYDRHHAKAAAS